MAGSARKKPPASLPSEQEVDAILLAPEARAQLAEVLDEQLVKAKLEGIVGAVVAKASDGEMAAVRALNHLLTQAKGPMRADSESMPDIHELALRSAAGLEALSDDELHLIVAAAGGPSWGEIVERAA